MANETGLAARAVITGAGGGIGRAIAVKFASLGINVALVARTQEKLLETAKACEALGVQAHVLVADLLDEQAIIRTVNAANDALGGIDVLVNNAGVVQSGPMVDVDAAEFDRVFATNVRAPFLLCKKSVLLFENERSTLFVVFPLSAPETADRPSRLCRRWRCAHAQDRRTCPNRRAHPLRCPKASGRTASSCPPPCGR